MAVRTWGRNMAPYWVLLRSYSVGSVKIVLAAGKVTSVMPCTSAARLTTRFSALDAIPDTRVDTDQPDSAGPDASAAAAASEFVTASSNCPTSWGLAHLVLPPCRGVARRYVT